MIPKNRAQTDIKRSAVIASLALAMTVLP